MSELEEADPELLGAKANRSIVEYYFTLTPAWMLYLLEQVKTIEMITYLDGDLVFYSDPEVVFEEIGEGSVAIVPHNFFPAVQEKEKCGKYNVGWLSFRKDEAGLSCLRWYRERCLEWCYDIIEEDRYADQKYLDYFADKFENVVIIYNPGVNLAPWNIGNYELQNIDGQIQVNGRPCGVLSYDGC